MHSQYFVYILYSEKSNRYYTGSSADPQKRLVSHNDPRNKGWTKRYAPCKIIHVEAFETKYDALMREKWLKSGTGRDFLRTLNIK